MPVRETFWNVPAWIQVATYLLGLLAVITPPPESGGAHAVWLQGKPAPRLDRPVERLRGLVLHGILQRRTLSQTLSGHHAPLHLLGHGHAVCRHGAGNPGLGCHTPALRLPVSRGWRLRRLRAWCSTFSGCLLLAGVALAAYRRYVTRPDRLTSSLSGHHQRDDAYVLLMLALFAITGYLIEGLRIAVTQPAWAAWSPVGNLIAQALVSAGRRNRCATAQRSVDPACSAGLHRHRTHPLHEVLPHRDVARQHLLPSSWADRRSRAHS